MKCIWIIIAHCFIRFHQLLKMLTDYIVRATYLDAVWTLLLLIQATVIKVEIKWINDPKRCKYSILFWGSKTSYCSSILKIYLFWTQGCGTCVPVLIGTRILLPAWSRATVTVGIVTGSIFDSDSGQKRPIPVPVTPVLVTVLQPWYQPISYLEIFIAEILEVMHYW